MKESTDDKCKAPGLITDLQEESGKQSDSKVEEELKALLALLRRSRKSRAQIPGGPSE